MGRAERVLGETEEGVGNWRRKYVTYEVANKLKTYTTTTRPSPQPQRIFTRFIRRGMVGQEGGKERGGGEEGAASGAV